MKKCFITFAIFILMLLLAGVLEHSNVVDGSIVVSDVSSSEVALSHRVMSQ